MDRAFERRETSELGGAFLMLTLNAQLEGVTAHCERVRPFLPQPVAGLGSSTAHQPATLFRLHRLTVIRPTLSPILIALNITYSNLF